MVRIDPLSLPSLLLEIHAGGQVVGTATGFTIQSGARFYLVTNKHVVSGRLPGTRDILFGPPEGIRIVHHSATRLGNWIVRDEPLYDSSGGPRWLELPAAPRVDIVALELSLVDAMVKTYPFDLNLAHTDMIAEPAMPVSIIGFPFGLTSAGAFPIWKTGHIASDPDLDYLGDPAFLIDATTRSGMSGSPVVLRLHGGYATSKGNYMLAGGADTRFMGVYSGRIHDESELGRVWRPRLISAILGEPNQPR